MGEGGKCIVGGRCRVLLLRGASWCPYLCGCAVCLLYARWRSGGANVEVAKVVEDEKEIAREGRPKARPTEDGPDFWVYRPRRLPNLGVSSSLSFPKSYDAPWPAPVHSSWCLGLQGVIRPVGDARPAGKGSAWAAVLATAISKAELLRKGYVEDSIDVMLMT